MPLLITYKGRPIKRRRRVGDGLRLTFYSPVSGERGEHLFVSQSEWLQFSRTLFVTRDQMPDVRRLAAS